MAKGRRNFFTHRKNFKRKCCTKTGKENRAPTDTVAMSPQHAQRSAETVRALSCENVTSQQACKRRHGVVGDCSRQHLNSELEYIRQPKQCNPSSTVVQEIRADQYRRQRLNEEHHNNLTFHVPSQFISICHGR